MRRTSRSHPTSCGSMCTDPAVRAGSPSTRRTPPFGSPTCRPAWWRRRRALRLGHHRAPRGRAGLQEPGAERAAQPRRRRGRRRPCHGRQRGGRRAGRRAAPWFGAPAHRLHRRAGEHLDEPRSRSRLQQGADPARGSARPGPAPRRRVQHRSGYQWATDLLDGPTARAAVFCANDVVAFGALDAARNLGLDAQARSRSSASTTSPWRAGARSASPPCVNR